jgi:hypothetical protein
MSRYDQYDVMHINRQWAALIYADENILCNTSAVFSYFSLLESALSFISGIKSPCSLIGHVSEKYRVTFVIQELQD